MRIRTGSGWDVRSIARLIAPDATSILLLGLRVLALVFVILGVPDIRSGAGRFFEIAHTPGIPYRDFPVEYPIGELILIRLTAFSSVVVARALLASVAFVADIATLVAVHVGWGRDAAKRYLILGTPLLFLMYRRSDLVTVALVVVGIALARRDRPRSGGFWVALAVLVKLWPLVVVPALAFRRCRGALRSFSWTLGLGLVAWVVLGGLGAIRQVVTFRGATGWEFESSIGAVVWTVTGDRRFEQGASRTGSAPGWARVALVIVLVAVSTAVWLRARRRAGDPAGAPALAAVAALLVLSPVLSPQYLLWIVPWAAIATLDDRRWFALALPPLVLTGVIATLWYLGIETGLAWNQRLLILRNATLLCVPLAYFVMHSGSGSTTTTSAAGDRPPASSH